MTRWFLQLPPEMQVALVVQLVATIFACGVWYTTVRFLRKEVKEVKARVEQHDKDLIQVGEELTALGSPRRPHRARGL